MADQQHSTPDVNPVAIDIAKEWNIALVEETTGKRRSFKFANRPADYQSFVPFLHALPGPVRVAFEPAGDYHRALGYRLLPEKLEVFSISSVALARFREARYGPWDKNDSKDAPVMLAMMKQGWVQIDYDPWHSGSQDWQELSNTYFHLTLARTRLQHSLLWPYIPLYFPELGRYWYSTRAAWLIGFLLRFPTASAVRALSAEAFVAEAWDLVGRKVEKRKKREEISALAAETVGRPVTLDSPAIAMFRWQLARDLELNQQREQLDLRAQELLAGHADFQRLQTLPGMAAVLALTILAEAGDLRRFRHQRQFLKYCGLDLSKSQSGQSRGKETLSRRGNKRLRMAFRMAGQRAVPMRENAFRDKDERYLRADPFDADRKRKALTAVAAKRARVVYAVIQTGSD